MAANEFLTIIKDIVMVFVAITGAIVAVKGLNTWQRQLKGQSEYELSRSLLVTLFKYRDSIEGVRHPAMWAYEMPDPPEDEASGMSYDQKRFYGTSKAYQARWDKVSEQRSVLYADLLEAEAIWGTELKDLFKVLFDLEYELFITVRHHLDLINPEINETRKEAISRIDEKSRDIMYGDPGDDEDEFRNDFNAGIETIEKYLKPKLSHA